MVILMFALTGCNKKAVPNKNNTDKQDRISVPDSSVEKHEEMTFSKPAYVVYDDDIEMAVFSADTGFYDEEFELELSCADKGKEIHFTTDGSIPTISSEIYTEKIKICDRSSEPEILELVGAIGPENSAYIPSINSAKGTVVRAAVFDKEGKSGKVVTNTYFVGKSQKNDYNGLPVIALTTDWYNLFDYEYGIYAAGKVYDEWKMTAMSEGAEDWEYQGNYTQKGKEWERPVHMELIEDDGNTGFEQELGMRIMGTASRTYNQKSFRIFARSEYGKKNIEYPLIPELKKENGDDEKVCKYKTFLLRNGGNDCDYTKLRDPFVQDIVSGRDICTQGSRPAIVFINGEYWGVYAIQEDYSDNYIEYNYGIDKNDVVMIKKGELEEGKDSDMVFFEDLTELLDIDLSNAENYEKLCSMADMQNFADYYSVLIYTANEDCITEGNNWRLWRSRSVTDIPYQDGKWRFMLYDTEFSLGLYKNGKTSTEDFTKRAMENGWFGELMKNDEFRSLFQTSLLETAELFKPDNAYPVLDGLDEKYGAVMTDYYMKFGPVWLAGNGDRKILEKHYKDGINGIRKFLEDRYEYVTSVICDILFYSTPVE